MDAGMLFEIKPADPVTHVVVAFGIPVVAVDASFIAAFKITKLDPSEVLRRE
jgi:ABC-type lipoprotein release transport system permease subunit